ncbi:Hypothetical protein HEAR1789 [Herminiimonas arsenicoxydans]|uniref:Uncharacterized protein n=1 Tax=Herminiimonas arsenicoxydans TaxID=204773 RepID=A4G608_HERAR|nr:Hypothetical protein HEAR1789 [Herminiimonas arsenicoxydans]
MNLRPPVQNKERYGEIHEKACRFGRLMLHSTELWTELLRGDGTYCQKKLWPHDLRTTGAIAQGKKHSNRQRGNKRTYCRAHHHSRSTDAQR